MNFYKHHIGDYDQATRHLSFTEDGAYCRLIRKYYAEESPLPVEIKKILRLIGARTKEEKAAVETVLEEFFELRDDGWHNTRCDAELEAAWAKASKNREVGKLGGRPRKSETQTEPTNNPNGSLFETQTVSENNPSQTPDTRHQTPDKTLEAAPQASTEVGAYDDDRLPPRPRHTGIDPGMRAVAIATLLTGAGVKKVTAFHPDVAVTWAQDERVTDTLLLAAVTRAKETLGSEPFQSAYLRPIIVELLNPPEPKAPKPREDSSWSFSKQGIEEMARKLGIRVLPMHSHDDVKRMCFDEIRKRKGA